ncbi:di-trans,poly-cis-decaprenylcistransferase, partial [bacterium]|nr:di-trans,poly-cis-decaprenylcistransferase [bacterium]
GLRRADGHREGVKSVREIVEACGELGVEVLTLYTFSRENWKRPRSEVEALMQLLVVTVGREIENLIRNNVRLRVIGRLEDLSVRARRALSRAIQRTEKSTGLILNLALSYGGRQEIVDAAKALAREGTIDFTEEDFAAHLYTAGLCDPDLLIRTSGELRLSNFLLWQLAYTEIVVTDALWPDFRRPQLLAAIEEYGRRERRFGAVTETE